LKEFLQFSGLIISEKGLKRFEFEKLEEDCWELVEFVEELSVKSMSNLREFDVILVGLGDFLMEKITYAKVADLT
jgi:hypothetical protein